MDDFLVRALVAGFGVAAVTGPLGCFVVWRRMAYFGDTLAHSALLGVTLGLLLGIDLIIGMVAVGAAVAVLLVLAGRRRGLATDTLLGIFAHGTLALGLIVVALGDIAGLDLMGYLFGDILAVSGRDIAWILSGGAAVLLALAFLWRPLLAVAVHEELAAVEGVPVTAVRLAFMLLLAVAVAMALKVVGILLITALLIIPAAAARGLSRTPERMAVLAVLAGFVAVGLGLWGSFAFDLPSGPSIVVAALILFALGHMIPVFTPRR